ncbi:hypothetical protein CFN78_13845 [Amycolatopsis antarctica]|uniref:YbaB/EbfC family DNA-binding protein n=1 Tax=Amycolatopsis antarctica TaxID=1854586 RepID=A0A263D2K1_9PSEU|nr:YbaB/EbfC family nucleoid-associated protein [Amycolatopsis antarctica]OZM72704.1 hypothetical protein CFN78_13845 [Amycolatopsis antarctica]
MTSPERLMADYDTKLQQAQATAQRMRSEMETVTVTERSKDGQIAVRVDYSGNLTGLEIGPAARQKPELAQEIMRTVRFAQSRLAGAMQEQVPSIAGTETMHALVGQLRASYPEPAEEGYVEGGGGYGDPDSESEDLRFAVEDDAADHPAPATPPAPPRRPARPERDPEPHEEDYFSGGGFLDDDGRRR